VVALYGDLGTGKTVLVRGIAAGLDVPPRAVSSPTFVLIHEYPGRLPLAHADLYRLDTPGQLQHVGLSEYLDGRTVVVIEWADKTGGDLPLDRLEAHLAHRGPTSREILLKATGVQSRKLLTRIRRARAGCGPRPRRAERTP